MLERFLEHYALRASPTITPVRDRSDILPMLGGQSFAGGLYRVYSKERSEFWTAKFNEVNKARAARYQVFASNWRGILYALDSARVVDLQKQVSFFLFYHGDEGYEIDVDIAEFHDRILTEDAETVLDSVEFEEWRTAGNGPLPMDDCIGYKIPPFLGGKNVISNMQEIDMDVEWTMTSELWQGIRHLPPGARIDSVSIGDAH